MYKMATKTKKVVRNEDKVLRKASNYISKNWVTIASIAILMVVMCVGFAFADGGNGGGTAEDMWDKIKTLVETWAKRLGGVVFFVGGIMFGLGWKREDADGKSQGIMTMVAGAIVIAIAELTSTFFA